MAFDDADITPVEQVWIDRAQAAVELNRQNANPTTVRPDNQPSQYVTRMSWAGIGGGTLTVMFKRQKLQFDGVSVGDTFGGFIGWGMAAFNFSLESMTNWEARFAIEGLGVGGGLASTQLWAMDGRHIGIVVAGGVGAGHSGGGGRGRFHLV